MGVITGREKITVTKNPHIGSSFEDWLDEANVREEVTAAAMKIVLTARKQNASKREVLGLEDFTDADIEALEKAEPPVESSAFNDELES